MKKNIIIVGGGMVNKGAQAMSFIAISELKKRFPGHTIYLYSPSDISNTTIKFSNYNFKFLGWFPLKFAKCYKNSFWRTLIKLRNKSEFLEFDSVYSHTDFIIDISGYALGSNWNDKICNDYLDMLEIAYFLNIPIYLMSQSFGPFDFSTQRNNLNERIKKLLPTAKVICAREQEGFDALKKHYNLDNVILAPDIVLNNKGINLESIFKTIPEIKVPDVKINSVAVIPNNRNFEVGDPKQAMDVYINIVSALLEKNKTVYILYHSNVDLKICQLIKDKFSDNDNVILLEQDFGCLEFNEIIKKFDFAVASRFHSIVHSYKNGIPCITVGWSQKYLNLLREFEQDKYMFDIRNNIERNDIVNAIDRIDQNRNNESNVILNNLPKFQGKNVFDIIER